MFSLIRGFADHFFQAPQYKILIVGTEGSGKTVIKRTMEEFAQQAQAAGQDGVLDLRKDHQNHRPQPHLHRLPDKYSLLLLENNYDLWAKKYQVLYWDVGGSLTQRSLWKKFFPECHGIIYVLDEGLLAAPDLL